MKFHSGFFLYLFANFVCNENKALRLRREISGEDNISFSDLVGFIARSADMLQLYNSEDVSVGVWLAPVALNRVHDIRFDTGT